MTRDRLTQGTLFMYSKRGASQRHGRTGKTCVLRPCLKNSTHLSPIEQRQRRFPLSIFGSHEPVTLTSSREDPFELFHPLEQRSRSFGRGGTSPP